MEKNHARENAKAWQATIHKLVAALECDYDRLEELRDERAELADDPEFKKALADWDAEHGAELAELNALATVDGETFKGADEVLERIQEGPLDLQVRSDWRNPCEYGAGEDWPVEAYILLSTGGPALRLMVELEDGTPKRAWMQHQDWGTPWTDYLEPGAGEVLLKYASCFYFGE